MAITVLFAWPVAALVLFAVLGRERGLIWSVVVGYLFLPEAISYPLRGLPDYDKQAAISLGVALGALAFRTRRSWADEVSPQIADRRLTVIVYTLLIVLVLASVMTMLDNRAPLINADRVRSGLSFRDVISMNSAPLIAFVPFFFALRWLYSPRHHTELLKVVVIVGSFYAFLALVEVRLSPQINSWVYGYFPHDWRQHLRSGGFRPVVFLRHGLWLGFFLFTAVIAGLALYRQLASPVRHVYLVAGLWILGVLMLSNNLGAVMLVVLFVPLVFLTPYSVQTRTATAVALIFLVYPAVRQSDILPTEAFLNFVSGISEERAASLQYRLDNEADMLLRASEKPIFGWGGWGRWRVIDELGRDTTTADGIWIIILGERGWVGYICYFGILTLPLLLLARAARRRGEPVPEVTAAMGIIMAGNLVYMVPNSTLSPIGWMITGALAAFLRVDMSEPPTSADTDDPPPRTLRYTRFAPHPGRPAGAAPLRRS